MVAIFVAAELHCLQLLNTLTRHSRAVLVLVVAGESDNALLCSASEDIVLVWNLCLPDCSGTVCANLASPLHCGFCHPKLLQEDSKYQAVV